VAVRHADADTAPGAGKDQRNASPAAGRRATDAATARVGCAGPLLRPATLLGLQRTAGNRAVGSVLSRVGAAPVQRQAFPPGTDPALVSKLDALVDRVAGELGAYSTFRNAPLDGAALPGRSVISAVSRFQDGQLLEPWMTGYARHRLGPANLKLLQEMISMNGVGFPDFDVLFGVAFQDPGHAYTCELKAATRVIDKAISKVTPIVTINYSNAFGWHWKRDYRLAGAELTVKGSVKPEIDPKTGKIKPEFQAGPKAGPITLDITGKAKADPTPIRYWGGNNFGGVVAVAKTAGKFKFGPAGGELGGMTAITFGGGPFGTISFPFFTKPGVKIGGRPGASVEVGIGMGVGHASGVGDTVIDKPPELVEVLTATPSFYTLTANIGPFETGSFVPPPSASGTLRELKATLEAWKAKVLDPQAEDLRRKGVDPDQNYRLDFYLTGTTSRAWRGASTEKRRLERNVALGVERATAVAVDVGSVFAGQVRRTTAASGGTSTRGLGSDHRPAENLTDEEAERVYEAERAEAMKLTDPEERRTRLEAAEHNFGRGSDQPYGRRVHVMVRWNGFLIIRSLAPAPAAVPTTAP
jgi:hypothetical protein